MVARLLSIGLGLGLLAQAGVAFLPLSAAHAGPAVAALQSRPPTFRPFVRGEPIQQRSAPVWRPRYQVASGPAVRRPLFNRGSAAPLIAMPRAGVRKAEPATRGQELGLRFRPDERESPYYGQSGSPPDARGDRGFSSESQSDFRPIPRRRKRTYEEMQSELSSPMPPPAPVLPYPSMAPPLPGQGRYWP